MRKKTPLSLQAARAATAVAAAVLCGTSLPLTAWNQNLKNWGLFHLIVVSGAHLVFLELLLRPTLLVFPLSWRKKLLVVFLVVFCFLSGLQPPLVRAFIHRLPLKSQSDKKGAQER